MDNNIENPLNDLRQLFMTRWLFHQCTAVFTAPGTTMIIDMAIEGELVNLTPEALVDMVSFMLADDSFPATVRMIHLWVGGLRVTEVEIDFVKKTVLVILKPPIKYPKITVLEDSLDQLSPIGLEYIVSTEVNM